MHQFLQGRPKRRAPAGFQKAPVTPQLLLRGPDEVFHGVPAATRFRHLVQQSLRLQRLGLVHRSAQNHPLRDLRSQLPRQQTVRAHAGKQVEQDFGETQLHSFFRDHEIARQRRLEASAQCIAADFRDGNHLAPETRDHPVQRVDAQPRIAREPRPIRPQHAFAEQIQVAAEIEHAPHVRAQHIKIHRPGPVANMAVQLQGIPEEVLGETRARLTVHGVPDRAGFRIV